MLKFALVGCGRIAKRHSKFLGHGQIAGASLVAVCDIGDIRSLEMPDLIPSDHFFNMPSHFDQIYPDCHVAAPLNEYLLAIGKPDNLRRAMEELGESDVGSAA